MTEPAERKFAQRERFDTAGPMGDVALLRAEIARFLRGHKDDENPPA
jgi:hypothetical protein